MSWVGNWLGHWVDGWLGGVGSEVLDRPGCVTVTDALYGEVTPEDAVYGDVDLEDAIYGNVTIDSRTCDEECCMEYDIGDTVRLTAAFTNAAGTAADPATVTLQIKDPSGNVDNYTYAGATVTKSATGSYYYDLSVDEPGTWFFRWKGTGAVATAEEGSFDVRESHFESDELA